MHYLIYELPSTEFEGNARFYLPLSAAVQYLDLQMELGLGFTYDRKFYSEIIAQSNKEWIEMQDWSVEMGHLTADLIEMNRAVAFCPQCCTYFMPSQIKTLRWHEEHGTRIWPPYHSPSGRLFLCSMGHELLKTTEVLAY
jgi:hypothetical protein